MSIKTLFATAAVASVAIAGTVGFSSDAQAHYRGYGYKSYGYVKVYPRYYVAPKYYVAPSYGYGYVAPSYGYGYKSYGY